MICAYVLIQMAVGSSADIGQAVSVAGGVEFCQTVFRLQERALGL